MLSNSLALRRLIPQKISKALIKIRNHLFCVGNRYTCPVCKKSYGRFVPIRLRDTHAQNKTVEYNIIGKGSRKNAICPSCGAKERQRLEYLYICRRTDMLTRKCTVLHFAPERALTELLCKNGDMEYYSGDIRKGLAMLEVDITDICFEDEKFDYVICNHVLEYVDETKAFKEILRVLKPGGKVIITVPVSTVSGVTLEKAETSDEEWLRLYGLVLDMRLYGTDYSDRIQHAGFVAETFCAGTDVPPEEVEKYALIKGNTIYIGTKPNGTA